MEKIEEKKKSNAKSTVCINIKILFFLIINVFPAAFKKIQNVQEQT